MMYYQIIRADGSYKNYKIFSEMLGDFDRQDVVDLLQLVKERYETKSPKGYNLLLWGDLKTLFEPCEEDEVWRNQQDYNLISYRLFDSCGVHVLLMNTGITIHMMVEKTYPFIQETLSRMLNRRLEVNHESEMAFELLRFTRSQLQNKKDDRNESPCSLQGKESRFDFFKKETNPFVTKSGQVHSNTAKKSSPRAAASISIARPVNTSAPKPRVNDALPTKYSYFKAHSPVKRAFNQKSAAKTYNLNEKVKSAKVNNVTTAGPKAVVSTDVGNGENAVKSLACWIWRPTGNVIDHTSKDSGSYMLKRFDYVDLQGRLKSDQGIFDNGCSRHMTGNKSFLIDYQEIDGGFVAFGRSPKADKITRKDESNLWHRRLGHINFKTMNKLVRGNLVRGLPSKLFENDHTCVACQKGKQHKASCKTKLVSSISQPLQMLHIDLFGPTSIRSINHKTYCLVVTDDYSRFSWVFFLATKDETSRILKTFITGIENQINHKVKIIRCDNGTEFKNNDMNQFCGMKGIKREFSVARTPQQNGVAKRKNRTLIEAARTMLADSLLPTTFWAEVDAVANDASKKTNEEPANEGERNGQEKDDNDDHLNTGIFRGAYDDEDVVCRRADLTRHINHHKFQTKIPQQNSKGSPKDQIIKTEIQQLKQGRMIKNLKNMLWKLTFFLGLQVKQKDDGIFISQDKSMIRSLMYLTASRPDIMFVVCACARLQVTPKVLHLHAVKRIFRYLKGQPRLGLWYPRDSPFDLEAFSDSDYAGASLDMKSTIVGCRFLSKRLISWQCKKQTIVANSTTEAEYVPAANCCRQNPVFHSKTKHIDIRHHFIRDSYEKKLIQFVDQHNMVACLERTEENAEFHQISIVKKIHATVDGKTIVISGSSVRSDLHFNDEDGITCLTNTGIFENLTLISLKSTSWNEFSTNIASAVICLATGQKFNFSKLIFDGDRPRKLPHFGSTEEKELTTGFERFCTTQHHDSPLFSGGHTPGSDEGRPNINELMAICTNLSTGFFSLGTIKDAQDLEWQGQGTTSVHSVMLKEEPRRATPVPTVQSQDKGKGKMVEPEPTPKNPRKAQIQMDEELAQSSKKRPRAEHDEESVKKHKLQDDAEKEELRDCLDIVQMDDIAIDVATLATKYPIVDWKTYILTENMMYYQIIRANRSSKNYKIFSEMLDDFDRQDVMDLYRLVNERYDTTSPEEYDLLLWEDLKTLSRALVKDDKSQEESTLSVKKGSTMRLLMRNPYLPLHVIHLKVEAKTTQAKEIASLKKRGRKIADLDADEEVTLIDETQERNDEDLMFYTDVLNGDEVFEEPIVNASKTTSSFLVSVADPITTAGKVVTTANATTTIDELTLAQTLIEIKVAKPKAVTTTAMTTTTTIASIRPKAKGIVFHDQEEQAPAFTPIVTPPKWVAAEYGLENVTS
ncbi:putative ribonuclease H-like domain-containing protein [Tanacetum coccineum]